MLKTGQRRRAARCWLVAPICGALLSLLPARAEARRFYRARFETEALELELPGEIELDSQLGGFYGDGQDGVRVLAPDIEVDFGVCDWLEIDLDGALSFTKLESTRHKMAGDPFWLSARVDALNWRDHDSDASFGIGLQVGPRLPSVHTPKGVGFAGLLLIGGGTRSLHLVANVGALIDYGQERGLLYGIDAEYELDERWSLLANFAAAYYLRGDPQQLLIAAGVSYKPQPRLALSLLAIGGPFVHGDRAGGLFGVSYSFQAWGSQRAGPRTSQTGPRPAASPQAPQPN
jgi:hypothetical protein